MSRAWASSLPAAAAARRERLHRERTAAQLRRRGRRLPLPPWRRAWRTWASWSRPRRALVALAAAALWTVVCLPLRMLGLAG